MYRVLWNQHGRAHWADLCGENRNKPALLTAVAKLGYSGHSGSRTYGYIFPAGWYTLIYSECRFGRPV